MKHRTRAQARKARNCERLWKRSRYRAMRERNFEGWMIDRLGYPNQQFTSES